MRVAEWRGASWPSSAASRRHHHVGARARDRPFRPRRKRFPGHHRRHGNGCRRADLRARRQRLDRYCDCVASAVGRVSVRIFGDSARTAMRVAYHLGRAFQLTNILRDLAEDAARGRLYLPVELLAKHGISARVPAEVLRMPKLPWRMPRCSPVLRAAHFAEADEAMARRHKEPRCARRAHARLLRRGVRRISWRSTGAILPRASACRNGRKFWIARAASAMVVMANDRYIQSSAPAWPAFRRRCNWRWPGEGHALRSRALRRRALPFVLDQELDCRIDNGNHLVLSGNAAIQDYLFLTEATGHDGRPGRADFPFFDIGSGERWTVRYESGALPVVDFRQKARVPGTRLARLFLGPASYHDRGRRMIRSPSSLMRVACFTAVSGNRLRSACLTRNRKRALGKVAGECFPAKLCRGRQRVHSADSQDRAFGNLCAALPQCAAPSMALRGEIQSPARRTSMVGNPASANCISISDARSSPNDWVILALPAWVTRDLLPTFRRPAISAPSSTRISASKAAQAPSGFMGLVGGRSGMGFRAQRRGLRHRELRRALRQLRRARYGVLHLEGARAALRPRSRQVPPHRIFKEKYATFAATPEQESAPPDA